MSSGCFPGPPSMVTGHIDPRYGDASAAAPDWAEVERRLTEAQLYWLVTVRADGRPHAVPVCGVWHDDAFAFCTGPEEQKMRNLQAQPRVAVTAGPLGAGGWATGKDIVVEGTAEQVTDETALRPLARAWEAKYDGDWRWEVRDGSFHELTASGAGTGRGALVFRVPPSKVLVFGDEHGQTTYRP
jgi:nitroimidazol reductase NimA-like FMN-containing flavoprotein (pyridoxamine 5'-phosphate oxidase superfamily)